MESLITQNQSDGLLNTDNIVLFKASGVSAIILVILYIFIIILYVLSGVPPTGGEEWLKHINGHTSEWWSILGLSVFTDLIYIPVAYSLYIILKKINKNAMLAGLAFIILFVFLDLAITWPNYSSLIALSSKYAIATNDVQRATIIATASYSATILSSSLIGFYIVLIPAIGIIIISLVMLRGTFSKTAAYIGVCTGLLGVVSILGPFFISALGIVVVITSILTTVWFLLVGLKLLKYKKLN